MTIAPIPGAARDTEEMEAPATEIRMSPTGAATRPEIRKEIRKEIRRNIRKEIPTGIRTETTTEQRCAFQTEWVLQIQITPAQPGPAAWIPERLRARHSFRIP